MKYIRLILLLLGVGFLVYFLFVFNKNKKETEVQDSNQQQQVSFDTKTDEQGQVTVKVTLQTFSKNLWKFNIVFDTHSIELNEDIIQIAELIDSEGNVFKPIAWEGAGPGGHHREGVLTFNQVQPLPEYVELKIKNIGGVTERSFRWNIK